MAELTPQQRQEMYDRLTPEQKAAWDAIMKQGGFPSFGNSGGVIKDYWDNNPNGSYVGQVAYGDAYRARMDAEIRARAANEFRQTQQKMFLDAMAARERQRQEFVNLGKQRSQQFIKDFRDKMGGYTLDGRTGTYRFNDLQGPYSQELINEYNNRRRELDALNYAGRNTPGVRATDQQAFSRQFVSLLTGADPNSVYAPAPDWVNQGFVEDPITGSFGAPSAGEQGFSLRAVGDKAYTLPVSYGGHTSYDLLPGQYNALEAMYRYIYGPGAIPRYDVENFTGDSATLMRAALKLGRTDQNAATDLINQARAARDTFGAPRNPFVGGFRNYLAEQSARENEAWIRTLTDAQAKFRQDQLDAANKSKAEREANRSLFDKVTGAVGDFFSNIAQSRNYDPYSQAGLGPSGMKLGAVDPARPNADSLMLLNFFKEQFVDIPYYAWQRARDVGFDNPDAIATGVFSLPLLRAVNPSQRSKNITSQVDSTAERQWLRENAGLTSLGENLMYDISKFVNGKGKYDATLGDIMNNPKAFLLFGPASINPLGLAPANSELGKANKWLMDREASGLADFAAQIALDPLTYSPLITGKLGKPAEAAANLAIRKEAASLAKSGAARLGAKATEDIVIDVSKQAVREAAVQAAVESRGGILRAIEGWLVPSAYLDDAGRLAAGGAARDAWLSSTQGQKWLGQAEQVISRSGAELKTIHRVLPDLDAAVAREVVAKASTEGSEAAMQVLRDAIMKGVYTPQINVRRQLLALIENPVTYDTSIAGRNVPLLLGRTSVKKNGGAFLNALERAEGRIGVFGPILGNTTSQKILNVAGRIASLNEKLPMDIWNEEVGADAIKGLKFFSQRLERVFDTTSFDDFPELVRLLQSLDVELTALAKHDPLAAETTMRSLEVVAAKLGSSSAKEADAAKLLLKRVAGQADDKMSAALDAAAIIYGEAVPRLRALDSMPEDVRITGARLKAQGGQAVPTAKVDYDRMVRELQAEVKGMVDQVGLRDAQLNFDLERRARLLERRGAELDASAALKERRVVLKSVRDRQIGQLRTELNTAKAELKAERDALRENRSWLTEYETAHRKTNATLPYHDRVTANADLTDWVERRRTQIREALADNLKSEKKLQKDFDKAVKAINEGWEKQANDPRVLKLEYEVDRSLTQVKSQLRPEREVRATARATKEWWQKSVDEQRTWLDAYLGIKGKKLPKVDVENPLTPIDTYLAGGGIPSRMDEYVSVISQNPDDWSDPLVKRAIEAKSNLYDAQAFSVGNYVDDWKALNAPINARFNEAWDGGRLIGPVANDPAGRGQLLARMKSLPDGLRVYFGERLAEAIDNGVTDLTKMGQEIERLATNKEFAHVVANQLSAESALAEFLAKNSDIGARKWFKVARKPAQLALSFAEPVAPRAVRFASHENEGISIVNRVEDMDRVLMDYGWDATTRAEVRTMVAKAKTQDEMYAIVKDMLTAWADNMGIAADDLLTVQSRMWTDQAVAMMVKDPVWREVHRLGPLPDKTELDLAKTDVLKGVVTPSQRSNLIPIMSADEARAIARSLIADSPDASFAQRALAKSRLGGAKFLDKELSKGGVSIRGAAKAGHSFWKLAVVTNAPVGMLAGGSAGLIFGDPFKDNDTIADRLKWGAIGAAIGSLGGIRYIARVAGVEERLRMAVVRGFAPREWVPGLSKMDDYGVELAMRHPEELVGTSAWASNHLAQGKLLVGESDEWIALAANDPMFVDAWARIVNRQLNPERNMIDRIVLQNFDNPGEDWRVLATEWLTKTHDGGLELQKILGGLNLENTPRNLKTILDNYEEFVTRYLPTEDLRVLRLGSPDGIPRDVFVDSMRAGTGPDVVHAQRMWRLPKSMKDLRVQYQQVYGRLVLERPTTKLNRVTMAKGIYREEFTALRRAGVAPEIARDLAEERSYRLTNKVMFQLNDESRFAAKADFFFPFQQPREELLRVYGSLVANNPARTLRLGRLAATAFNNGVSDGIFYEDGMGEWRMRVPGSAYLSRVFSPPGTDGTAEGFDFRVRDLFFLLQGNAFAASDGTASPSGLLLGTMPTPGGPYWQQATSIAMHMYPDAFESLQKDHPFIFQRLFPYGVGGSMMRQETNRLWMAFSKSTPPWEFVNRDDQEAQLHRLGLMVEQELLSAHRDDPGYAEWLTTDEGQREVANQVSGLLLAWAAVGSVTPATTRPYFPGQAEFDSVARTLKESYGEEGWVGAMWKVRPDLAEIYLNAKTSYVGDTTSYEDWLGARDFDLTDMTYGRRVYLTPEEFAKQLADARTKAKAMQELSDAWNGVYIHSTDRYAEVEAVKAKWADKGVSMDDSYLKEKELAHILYAMPKHLQDNAINEWRIKFDVAPSEYTRLIRNVQDFKVDVRREARDFEAIDAEVRAAQRQNDGRSLEDIVAGLPNVAEQEKFWQYQISTIPYADEVSPALREMYGDSWADSRQAEQNQAPLTTFYAVKGYLSKLYADNPSLRTSSKPPRLMEELEKMMVENSDGVIDALNEKISEMYDAGAAAAKAKDWTTYYALKSQREELRQQKLAVLDSLYKQFPSMVEFQADLQALTVFAKNPDSEAYRKNLERLSSKLSIYGIPVIAFTGEERQYRDMPFNVRAAFRATLIDRLNKSKGEDGKLYWDRLTPFQKDILQRGPLPDSALEKWKSEDPNARSGGGRRSYSYGSRTSANSELAYAYGLMKQYNKRGAGAKAPAAYAEYRLIPASDAAGRAAFLKAHPEVRDWIALGPMANMPPIDQMIVANIMVKYGKWEGEEMSAEELTNLAWARQQMETWSRRDPANKPDTYDIWVNMPTGVEKAQYLEQHPEIGEWVKAGPMANMPDMYREVVRDIMMRYGQWTSSNDPLGETLTQFYATPPQLKQQFLAEHPELEAYWKAIRTPEEQRMADLTERYFALDSAGARTLFLNAHPELRAHFVESRQRRYERFLNQVAVYMGSNPELFNQYMEKQTAVLNELIARFGTPSLLRERFSGPTGGVREGTSGRVRRAA